MDITSLLSSFFLGEHQGKALQRQGEISKDQIQQFFAYGKQLFEDQQFKLGLAMAHRNKQCTQTLVDKAQAQVWEQKVTPAVQGDYGINTLATLRVRFSNDAEMLKMFYEFVHLEEKALDEAEMPGELFTQKYESIYAMKKVMEEQMAEHKEELDGLSPEERDKYMAEVFRQMLAKADGSACGDNACSSCPTPMGMTMSDLPPRPTTQAPAPLDGPSALSEQAGSSAHQAGGQARVMLSEEEQMAFFKNLSRS